MFWHGDHEDPIEKEHSVKYWRSGEGFFYLSPNKLQWNSGLKEELRIKRTRIIKDYQDYTTVNWHTVIIIIMTIIIHKHKGWCFYIQCKIQSNYKNKIKSID